MSAHFVEMYKAFYMNDIRPFRTFGHNELCPYKGELWYFDTALHISQKCIKSIKRFKNKQASSIGDYMGRPYPLSLPREGWGGAYRRIIGGHTSLSFHILILRLFFL